MGARARPANAAERLVIAPSYRHVDLSGHDPAGAHTEHGGRSSGAHSRAGDRDRCMQILPTVIYETCPPLDLIMVPGGPGQQKLMEYEATSGFLRRQAAAGPYMTSLCPGS